MTAINIKIVHVRGERGRFVAHTALVKAAMNKGLDDALSYLMLHKMNMFLAQPWPPPKSQKYREWKIRKGYGDRTLKKSGAMLRAMKGKKIAWNRLEWGILDDADALEKMRLNESGAGGREPRSFLTAIIEECREPVRDLINKNVLAALTGK